jgi:haloacetate dehalogenase
MARDQVAVMQALGFERFYVAGNDRGARTAYRMALDHPGRVEKLAVLDIIPTVEMWDQMDSALAMKNWHWLFLAQPEPFPELMITRDPDEFYLRSGRERFDPRALSEYLRAVEDPATVHAMCEDYRAGATIDRRLDALDRADGRLITSPMLVLWSAREEIDRMQPSRCGAAGQPMCAERESIAGITLRRRIPR